MAQKIIVEGDTDIHFITHLCMVRKVDAPKGYKIKAKYINEFVSVAGSKSKLLNELKLLIKNPSLDIQNLGLILDADSQTKNAAIDTWLSIKAILEKAGYENLPDTPNAIGTIIEQEDKPKIGIWIMPNNLSNGYLEDFYEQLIHKEDEFWQKSVEITEGFVENKNNRFKEIALQKAKVHTWLAWQENPELPLGLSISANAKYLNFDTPLVDNFIEWFKNTFELET